MPLQPIHRAAYDGNLVELNRLIAEDAVRLNARSLHFDLIRNFHVIGCTPLMLAAWRGHDAVVARLLALGADVHIIDLVGQSCAHWACRGRHASALALLLDAGAPINVRALFGTTPLILAAHHGAIECVQLLLARGGDALEMDVMGVLMWNGSALHWSAAAGHGEIVQLLLQAGADPTVRDSRGRSPLDHARTNGHMDCNLRLQAATAEPQRPRLLLKARALLDAAHKIRQVQLGNDGDSNEEQPRRRMRTRGELKRRAVAAAPAYLKGRVQQGQELPRVTLNAAEGGEELAAVVVDYALNGMVHEVFLELFELMVPKWDLKNV